MTSRSRMPTRSKNCRRARFSCSTRSTRSRRAAYGWSSRTVPMNTNAIGPRRSFLRSGYSCFGREYGPPPRDLFALRFPDCRNGSPRLTHLTRDQVSMLVHVASAFVLSMAVQMPSMDRGVAEQLARSGRTVEALALFERIVSADPTDVEARLWIARLQLRIGRTEDAEAGFRSVLRDHPSHLDARIGLGAALTRKGDWREALIVLHI